jgi:electron transfer flavoprotein-quinone oxidoreductase
MGIEKFDVIISGAGPAGSKCAETLANEGFDVALIERDTSWRKPCGGGVSARIFKYFPQLKEVNPHQIESISMYSGNYNKLKYTWGKERHYSINMDRLELDNIIRNVAINAGAYLFDNHLSYDFIWKNNHPIGIKTKTTNGIRKFFGKIIIVADGMSSKLAIKSGLRGKWKIDELGLAKCAIIEGDVDLENDCIHVFFRPYKGYGWIFPLGNRRFNVGCGTFEEANRKYNLNTIYQEFLSDPYIKSLLSRKDYRTVWEGAYPLPALGVRKDSLYGKRVMLIGDAAGFVSPISGEGIHPGIVSGKAAAEAAIHALEQDDISKHTLKQYKRNENVRKIIRNFKIKRSMVDFFYENEGQNLSNMFKLANEDDNFRQTVVDMFLFNAIPPKDFFEKVRTLE